MQIVLTNNFSTTISAGIGANSGSVTLTNAANLPTLAAGQVLPVTLNDFATRTKYEICYVTAISGSTLTITRAQEGTTAQVWSAGDFIFASITSGSLADYITNFNGSITALNLTGGTITATTEFSGPGTGLTGTASGLSIGGNAATATAGVTPAQFDNSTNLATTAFIKRAGIQLSAQVPISASTTLTASQAGNWIVVVNTTGNITITLPASNSAATGDLIFGFWNPTSYKVTIAAPSGDVLPLSTTTLQPNQTMAVYNDGTSSWQKMWNEADTYQAVAPVYAGGSGASPWNPYTVTATITAPKAGWVLAAAKWVGTGSTTNPPVTLSFNGTSFSGDQANPYEQVEYGYVNASPGEVINVQYTIGTQGSANNATVLAWFVPQAN